LNSKEVGYEKTEVALGGYYKKGYCFPSPDFFFYFSLQIISSNRIKLKINMPTARNFFTTAQQDDIRQAIMSAELDTSGEIRVHIENTCTGDALDRALVIFKKLGMEKTESRNGVLIYLAVKNRKFAIIGDEAIHTVVTESYWDSIKNKMLNHFRENRFSEGLIEAIIETGHQLKKHFPYQTDDVNELPDEISFN
jgi:uncharacterized membrane protein